MGYAKENEYIFKTGSHLDQRYAQKAGEQCQVLSSKGMLNPASLVDMNRDANAPLHNMFEWDDTKAGELYRQGQAGHIIRSIETVVVSSPEPVRAYFPVKFKERENNTYTHINVILSDTEKRNNLISLAITELIAFENKYKSLKELANVFKQIDLFIEENGGVKSELQ